MWQRFTEAARRSVFHAQQIAQTHGEGYVSTEHLLLGILRDPENFASKTLQHMEVGLEQFAEEILQTLPLLTNPPSAGMTLTPRAKLAIDLAWEESQKLNQNYIGTEHLLLGLICEGDGVIAMSLRKKGIELEQARMAVQQTVSAN